MTDWKRKLSAFLHDPPEKVLDIPWHKQRAENYEQGLGLEDARFRHDCDHTAAAADRLPWPRWQFLESSFDGTNNYFKHPLGGDAKLVINPYPDADLAHHFASLGRPVLAQGDDRAQFLALWRLWRWWASDNKDSRNGDITITSAVLDRLLHHAQIVLIEGTSYRMKDRAET
jgi:CRISPR-associated protein Cmr2